jgi:hypothetical protein
MLLFTFCTCYIFLYEDREKNVNAERNELDKKPFKSRNLLQFDSSVDVHAENLIKLHKLY